MKLAYVDVAHLNAHCSMRLGTWESPNLYVLRLMIIMIISEIMVTPSRCLRLAALLTQVRVQRHDFEFYAPPSTNAKRLAPSVCLRGQLELSSWLRVAGLGTSS